MNELKLDKKQSIECYRCHRKLRKTIDFLWDGSFKYVVQTERFEQFPICENCYNRKEVGKSGKYATTTTIS